MFFDFFVFIFIKDVIIIEEFYYYVKRYNKNILLSNEKVFVIVRKIKFFFLKVLFIEEEYENYFFMEIYGVGVLMLGYFNVRKGVMIELIERGYCMVIDKNFIIWCVGENDLVGYNVKKREKFGYFYLEDIKGGYVDVIDYFGVKFIRIEKKINIFIVFEEWNEKEFYDRFGFDV